MSWARARPDLARVENRAHPGKIDLSQVFFAGRRTGGDLVNVIPSVTLNSREREKFPVATLQSEHRGGGGQHMC